MGFVNKQKKNKNYEKVYFIVVKLIRNKTSLLLILFLITKNKSFDFFCKNFLIF